jgi:hypothetical protein
LEEEVDTFKEVDKLVTAWHNASHSLRVQIVDEGELRRWLMVQIVGTESDRQSPEDILGWPYSEARYVLMY